MLHCTIQCQLTHSSWVCQNFQFCEGLLAQKHDKQCLLPSQVLFVSFMDVICQTVKVESFAEVLNRLLSWVELVKVTVGHPCCQICCVPAKLMPHVSLHSNNHQTCDHACVQSIHIPYLLCLYNRCIVRHVVEA